MKKKKTIGVGEFPNSRPRWWNDKSLEASEPPSFQRFQFDSSLVLHTKVDEITLSPKALAALYGDSSLDWHVTKLLDGIHELATATTEW